VRNAKRWNQHAVAVEDHVLDCCSEPLPNDIGVAPERPENYFYMADIK